MEHFRQHTTMLNELLNTVSNDIVSVWVHKKRAWLNRCYSRLAVLNDQVYVRRS